MPNAIVSVFDKTNLNYLGKILSNLGFNIYATAGTLNYFIEHKIEAFPVETIAKNPAGFGSLISSLSFNTLIGTLANNKSQLGDMPIELIDLVVYNFVPTWSEIKALDDFNVQHVDLGGPTMIKAAAINYKHALPIISPCQYALVPNFYKLSMKTRLELATKALAYCSWYDNKLSEFLMRIQND